MTRMMDSKLSQGTDFPIPPSFRRKDSRTLSVASRGRIGRLFDSTQQPHLPRADQFLVLYDARPRDELRFHPKSAKIYRHL